MDYTAWKLFIDATELGSLSKVAAAYGTSQPQISRQICQLEEESGGRLFLRTGRGVVLTELGQRMMPKVRAWLAITEQLKNELRTTAGLPMGKVCLGIPAPFLGIPASSPYHLISLLYRRLWERYPLIQLIVREGYGAQLETWLEDGSTDLAILLRQGPTPMNGNIYYFETAACLVGAAGDQLTSQPTVPFSALHNLPLVTCCRPSSFRDHLDQLSIEHGVSLNVMAEVDSLRLQKSIVAEGGMYALLEPYAIATATRDCDFQISKLVDPVVIRHMALAMPHHGELTLACRMVKLLIKEIVQSGEVQLMDRTPEMQAG